ncbi:MAG: MoaD/ThiS family protein [Candidatus Njordarchaeales archaeon]
MQVKVRYFAYLRQLTNEVKEEEISLPDDATIRDLLNVLVEKYGEKLEKVLFESSQRKTLSENIIVLINGQSVNDLGTKLKNGDIVSIMPFLSGG